MKGEVLKILLLILEASLGVPFVVLKGPFCCFLKGLQQIDVVYGGYCHNLLGDLSVGYDRHYSSNFYLYSEYNNFEKLYMAALNNEYLYLLCE